MKKEQQSFESQLQMARPKRSEVKRVPLTPEEKEFLGEIMGKAVAAEKAGELKEALNLYTDYKNELFKIKEEKEKKEKEKEKEERGGIKWTKEKLENWIASIGIAEEDFVENHFNLFKLPKLESKGFLNFSNLMIATFPANMEVNGDLILQNAEVKKWIGSGLRITGGCKCVSAKIKNLPLVQIFGLEIVKKK